MNSRPTIGISWFVHKDPMPIWVNGAAMNVAFLHKLFVAGGYDVIALNGGSGKAPGAEVMLGKVGLGGLEFVPIADAIDKIDVLIECGAQLYARDVDSVRKRGGKAIAYKFGNSFVLDMQRAISDRPSGSIFNGAQFDEIWTNAQHVNTCGKFWETCYRAKVRVLPHIWEPCFVDAAVSEFPEGERFGYVPGRKPKRIAIYEPNIDVVKTCYIPLLCCEEAFRYAPDSIGEIYVCCALELNKQESFRHFIGNLDVVRAGRVSAEGRFNFPWFQSRHADVVVSHQWENALNYAYYDALYGGYPLVHNSELLPDGVGYRYHGFDCQDGGRVLREVIEHHDDRATEYRRESIEFLETVRATAPRNIHAHERALESLFN